MTAGERIMNVGVETKHFLEDEIQSVKVLILQFFFNQPFTFRSPAH